MSSTSVELINRFHQDINANQERLNWIKDQLRKHQPITEEDNHFFEHFTNYLFSNLRLILNQINSSLPTSDASSAASTSTSSSIGSKRNRILDPDQPTKKPRHSPPKPPPIQPFIIPTTSHHHHHQQQQQQGYITTPEGHTPLTNRSLSLGEIHASRELHHPTLCSALSTPATTPGGTTASSARRRELATPAQKAEILNWYHSHGSNQTQTAKHFNDIYPALKLSQAVISGWLKGSPNGEEPGLKRLPSCSSTTTTPSTSTSTSTSTTTATTTTNRRRQQKTKHVQVTEALEKWCAQAVSENMDLNGDVIREKWREFARFYQIPPSSWLKLSEGWLSSFKERNGLKGFKRLPNLANRNKQQPTPKKSTTSSTNKNNDQQQQQRLSIIQSDSSNTSTMSPIQPLLPPPPHLVHQPAQHHQHHPHQLVPQQFHHQQHPREAYHHNARQHIPDLLNSPGNTSQPNRISSGPSLSSRPVSRDSSARPQTSAGLVRSPPPPSSTGSEHRVLDRDTLDHHHHHLFSQNQNQNQNQNHLHLPFPLHNHLLTHNQFVIPNQNLNCSDLNPISIRPIGSGDPHHQQQQQQQQHQQQQQQQPQQQQPQNVINGRLLPLTISSLTNQNQTSHTHVPTPVPTPPPLFPTSTNSAIVNPSSSSNSNSLTHHHHHHLPQLPHSSNTINLVHLNHFHS
ncbi:hypothetical protein MJO28_006730 [Puccinia striiformis f. sp. tritici]|uniref:Uncharacterized protein n=1 Tax=Puccinia striiformis f. sp. tritici TaxID=168172 RepID=A0ACC0EHV6_9BASI|nr:hypothetical protein MJO28_006730 [Puccinia striiformis f. sp. tritici]